MSANGASILDAIGNTPLVRLRRIAPPSGAELWLKLEYCDTPALRLGARVTGGELERR